MTTASHDDHGDHDHHDDHHHHHDEHCDHEHRHDHDTAIPMLMTTNKPPATPRRRARQRRTQIAGSRRPPTLRPKRDERKRGRGAVPADDLAVAVLSGRRVLLFQRHRMGGGSRRYRRCGILAGLAWRDARGRAGILRRRVSGARASGRVIGDDAALARYRGACGGLRALARAPARNLGAGPRLHRHRARGMELRRA